MMPDIIAIDPGLAYIGVVYVDGDGMLKEKATIKLGGKMDPDERVALLQSKLEQILFEWEKPDLVVLEQFACYGFKGAITNAFQMGRVVQAIYDVLLDHLIPAKTLSARDARRYVTGNAGAKSAQIREGLRLMGYDGRMNDHTRDALALALCWLDREKNEGEQCPSAACVR